MPPPLSNKKSAPQKIRKKKIFGCRPLNLRGTSIPSLSLFSTIQNAKSLREYLRLNIRATQFCVSIPNRSFASGSLSARSRIAFFSKNFSCCSDWISPPLCQLEFFSLSTGFLSFFPLSLQKKTRLSHALLYQLIVPVSDRTLGAEMNRVVCVFFATEIYVDAVCLYEEKLSQSTRKYFFPAIFAIFNPRVSGHFFRIFGLLQ